MDMTASSGAAAADVGLRNVGGSGWSKGEGNDSGGCG